MNSLVISPNSSESLVNTPGWLANSLEMLGSILVTGGNSRGTLANTLVSISASSANRSVTLVSNCVMLESKKVRWGNRLARTA